MPLKKKPKPKPRPVMAWATMTEKSRHISQVYVGQPKQYVQGDCFGGEIVVRVRILPA
jgi:hypothetical protein